MTVKRVALGSLTLMALIIFLLSSRSLNSIRVIALYDSLCIECSHLNDHWATINSMNLTQIIERVDYRSIKGVSLVNEYNIKELPTIIIKSISDYPEVLSFYSMFGTVESDDYYVFRTNIALDNFYYERLDDSGGLSLVNTNNINVSGKQSIGNPDAEFSIIEFSDFSCESCNLSMIIINELISRYDVKFYFKHYPLDSSCNSKTDQERGSCFASIASECAAKQGKFWEYHNILFENQDFSINALKNYAESLGLNTDEFNQCLDNNETLSIVLKDISDGFKAGVIGTPMFYINGKVIIGIQPLSVFSNIIKSL